MLYTTLQYNGVEKSLADWGISEWDRDVANQANDHFELTVPMPMDGIAPYPYGANVIISINRACSTANPTSPTLPEQGAVNTFSGGTQWFWGYAGDPDRIGDPGAEYLVYKFYGPYEWFFGRLKFEQSFLTWNGTKLVLGWQSNIILGLSLNTLTGQDDTVPGTIATNLMSIAQVVKQICMYAQADSVYQQATNGLGWPGTAQFSCDQLTQEVDSINFDLLESPSANVLISDFYLGAASGQTSASVYPASVFPTAAVYQLRAPLDAMNGATCADCLKRELGWLGGIGTPIVWTDHSQTPPQLHIATSNQFRNALALNFNAATGALTYPGANTIAARLAGGNAITLPMNPIVAGQPPPSYSLMEKIKIKRRNDLIPAAVALQYLVAGTNSGAPYNQAYSDIAAYLKSDGTPGVPGAAGVSLVEGIGVWDNLYDINHPAVLLSDELQAGLNAAARTSQVIADTINIKGDSSAAQSCTITAQSISGALGNASDAAWPQIFTGLKNTASLAFYNSGNPAITITSPDGGTVYYDGSDWTGTAYTNWVEDGQVAPWMLSGGTPASPVPGSTVRAVIRVNFSYDEKTMGASGNYAISKHVSQKEWSTPITLSTLPSGTYSSQPTFAQGEPVPWGLAGFICQLESIPQYEGSVVVQEKEITDVCPVGNSLNLTGGLAEWATMFAVVQEVSYGPDGKTTISFGPAKHLGANQFFQRLRSNIGRQFFDLINPNPLNTGGNGPGQLGNNIPAHGPTTGGDNIGLQQWLTDPSGQQGSSGNVDLLPSGVTIDSGAAENPAGFATAPQLILSAGSTSSSPYIRAAMDSAGPNISVHGEDDAMAALYDSYLTLTDGTVDPPDNLYGISIGALDAEITLYDGTNTAGLTPSELSLGNGSDSIVGAISDISGLGEAKFRSLGFCQAGTNYTAAFWMTAPVESD